MTAIESIFQPNEVIGFSGPPSAPWRSWQTPALGAVYFCINPLKARGLPLANASIAEARNFLIEFDKQKIPAQKAYIKSKNIPYNTMTFSGGKSIQLIVSLSEPCDNAAEYKKLFRMLVAIIPKMDSEVGTISRLARIPGATRENGHEQKLLKVTGKRLSKEELKAWAYETDCIAYNTWEWEEKQLQLRPPLLPRDILVTADTPIPSWIQAMIDDGKIRGTATGNNRAVMNAGWAMKQDGYASEVIIDTLYKLQDALGAADDHAKKFIKWQKI